MQETCLDDATAVPATLASLRKNWLDHAVPCLGIVWHPDPACIGMIAPLAGGQGAMLEVSRFEPVFRAVYSPHNAPLRAPQVSRQPLKIRRLGGRSFEITPPDSRMSVSVNGRPIAGATTVSLDELGEDILINLSDTIVLALFEALLPMHLEAAAHGLIGVSKTVHATWDRIRQMAPTGLPVLIRGATGTGKELVARAIHALGRRADRKLHTLNMAALSPSLAQAELFGAVSGAYTGATRERDGLFPLADGATLFMDEVGDTPETVQPMLLRVLENGEYRKVGDTKTLRADVRVISATDRPLEGGAFNQPLRQRLEGAVIEISPLRQRRVDIGLLLRHFLTRQDIHIEPFDLARLSVPQLMPLLLHDWPGNIRELVNTARQIRLGVVPKPDLADCRSRPSEEPAADKKRRDPATVGEEEMIAALDGTGWNVKAAADFLNVSRTSFYRLMERSDRLKAGGDIPEERLRDVMDRHPGDMDAWAQGLRVPKDMLRRRIRRAVLQ